MFNGIALRIFLLALLLIGLSGCAARQTVVLVPDANGHVGKAEVSTAAGTRVLQKAGDMTQVTGTKNAPSDVKTADPAYIRTTFGEALSVEPSPSAKFILYFETGTTDLRTDSEALVPAIAKAVRDRSAVSISISGHTDATGSDKLNNALSLNRAEKIKELLVHEGVNPNIMMLSSHGKGNPAIPTPDGVAEPRNRRVEVIVR
jgi:outer membrane protein OmpA-like peptidoglycan-associated protein